MSELMWRKLCTGMGWGWGQSGDGVGVGDRKLSPCSSPV